MSTIRTGILASVLTAMAIGAGPAQAGQKSTLDTLRAQGFVRAAFANEAPYGYVDKDNNLTGESPEVAKVIFKRLGIPKVDGVLTEWASLLPGLNVKRWDVVAAGMFITPKRCKEAAFSNPSYKMGPSFLVKAGNPHNLHSYADVAKQNNVVLGVLAGAVERGYARDAGIPDDRVKELPDQASMLAAVKSGRVDAAALTSVSIERMAEHGGPDVERASPFEAPAGTVGYGGFAFRKGDKKLVAAFNKELKKFIGTEEHLKLVKPFGFTKANLPGDVTAKELCEGKK